MAPSIRRRKVSANGRLFLVTHGDQYDAVIQCAKWVAKLGSWAYDVSIVIKPGSRELVESWAPGRGIGNYAASATIEARKPV